MTLKVKEDAEAIRQYLQELMAKVPEVVPERVRPTLESIQELKDESVFEVAKAFLLAYPEARLLYEKKFGPLGDVV